MARRDRRRAFDLLPTIRPDRGSATRSNLLRVDDVGVTHDVRSTRPTRRPPRPLADRRPAPGPRPDVPARLARRAVGRGPGRSSGSRTSTPPASAPRPARGARRPPLARPRLGRRAGRRRPVAPYVQSRAGGMLRDGARAAEAAELVYPCTCTRADIARAASAPHAEDEGPTYPGTCSGRTRRPTPRHWRGRPFAWRFRVPTGPVAWDDLVPGRRSTRPVASSAATSSSARDGHGPSYQLAVVRRRRGDGRHPGDPGRRPRPEHPAPDPALPGARLAERPTFGHVPLVVGPDGRRLAKRDGSIKLATLRERRASTPPARRLAGPFAAAGPTASNRRGRRTGSDGFRGLP